MGLLVSGRKSTYQIKELGKDVLRLLFIPRSIFV